MKTLITIGTDEGVWAPPTLVELGVTIDTPGGLGITNSEEVRWPPLQKSARIVHAAIATGTGEWVGIDLSGPVLVEKGQEVVLAARALAINVELNPLSVLDRVRLGSQPEVLERMRRLLN